MFIYTSTQNIFTKQKISNNLQSQYCYQTISSDQKKQTPTEIIEQMPVEILEKKLQHIDQYKDQINKLNEPEKIYINNLIQKLKNNLEQSHHLLLLAYELNKKILQFKIICQNYNSKPEEQTEKKSKTLIKIRCDLYDKIYSLSDQINNSLRQGSKILYELYEAIKKCNIILIHKSDITAQLSE